MREIPLAAPQPVLPAGDATASREAPLPAVRAPLATVAPPLPQAEAPLPAPELALPSRDAAPALQEASSPADQAAETVDARLAMEQDLSGTNRLRADVQSPRYPATGQPSVSQTALLRAADAQPGGPDSMLDGNLLLIEAHELAETAGAIEQYTQIVELCHAGLQAGVETEAVQFAHELTAWAYNRRGEAYEALGEANKALVDFNAAVTQQPTRWQAVHNRGVSLAQAGRVQEAIDDFSRTIQLQPRFAKAYSNRAAIREQQGKFREALVDFQKAAELDHTMAAAHAGAGRALLQLNRHRDALAALDEAVRIEEEDPAFLTSRGDVYAAMGDFESALADYGRAIEVDPTFATAYRNGSWLLATCPDARFRDDENAIIGAEKALDLAFGDRHLCLDTLAAAHASAGDFDKAVEVAQQAIDEAPRGVQAFYQTRLKMYEQRRPFRTESAQQAGYVEAAQ
jgi:tetratricopeptide (TPR) repeat protein